MNGQCIQVSNLTKSFSGRKVVNDISFAVNKGEVFALLGHNGAGKSTTIDLILGLKCTDEGNATILGMDPLIITRKGTMIGGFLYATKSKCSRRFGWKQNCIHS